MLWDKNKVTLIEGEGSLTDDGNVAVGGETYEAKAVVLATGSVALPIPGRRVLRPDRRHLGRLVAARAAEAARGRRRRRLGLGDRLRLRALRHRGDPDRDARRRSCRSRTRTWPASSSGPSSAGHRRSSPARRSPTSRTRASRSSSRSATPDGEADYLAIAGGRAPDTEALNLAGAKVETEENGKIKVDEFQRTSNPKVFAIGDLVRGPALAHKASEEGVVAVETIAGAPTHAGRRRPDPRRDLLPPAGRERRAHRGGREGGRARHQGRPLQARRRRRLGRLRRPRGHGEDRRRRRSTARSSAPTSSATAPAT